MFLSAVHMEGMLSVLQWRAMKWQCTCRQCGPASHYLLVRSGSGAPSCRYLPSPSSSQLLPSLPWWLSGKVSATRATDQGLNLPLPVRVFSRSCCTSDRKTGTLAATLPGALMLWIQWGDWLIRCQYTVTGWDCKFDLKLFQCGSMHNCLSSSVC